jgi:hypothetical protein
MKVGRLQKNRWNAGLSIEPKIYQSRSHLKKMKMQNKYDPASSVMIDGVRQED